MAQSKYSRDEVNAILGRAIQQESNQELSHEDLLATAREIGISEQAIEFAAIELAAERRERAELGQLRRDQWRGFVAHLIPYVMVNALLVTINVLTTHFPWALFPALGWGIGIASHLWAVLFPTREHQKYHIEQFRALEAARKQPSTVVAQADIEPHARVVSDVAETTHASASDAVAPKNRREA